MTADAGELTPVIVVKVDAHRPPVGIDVGLVGAPAGLARAVLDAKTAEPRGDGVWCYLAINGQRVAVRTARLTLLDGTLLDVVLAVRPEHLGRGVATFDVLDLRRHVRA